MVKKIVAIVLMIVLGVTAVFVLTACGGEKNIAVIGREAGSGTRSAYEELIKNADGEELGDVGMVKTAEELPKTSDVLTKVSTLPTAIGYVSLGSVNDTVKKLSVNGVEATSENVIDGTYKLARPFVIMTNKAMEGKMQALTADFISFLQSRQAQEIVVQEGYVTVASDTDYSAPDVKPAGDAIVIKGSTSVDPLMDKLIAKYLELNGTVSQKDFNKDCQGSSAGKEAAKNDKTGNVIGLSSAAVTDAALATFNIAQDAIAVIVNTNNTLTDITIEQLFDVYSGAVLKFSELTK